MSTATLTSKGQLTLPKEVRERMGLKAGDQVVFLPNGQGGYDVMPKRPLTELFGSLPNNGVHLTTEEIDQAIDEFWEMRANRA